MKIELKNIKHSEFASHETHCYQATIYIDGKRVGTVENQGYGGCDFVHPASVAHQINEYAKTLPKIVCHFIDPKTGKPAELDQDCDIIFGELVNDWLKAKDLKRMMSKRVLFIKQEDGKIYQTKTLDKSSMEQLFSRPALVDQLKAKTILNLLPFDQALNIYKGATA
jgi:hypothetical protein